MAIKLGFLAKFASKQTVEVTKQVSDSFKAVFDLAKAMKEKPLDGELLKHVGQFGSLLDALNSPLGSMVKELIPFASIGVTLLNLICEATKQDPTLEECMALIVQEAYLRSVRLCWLEDPIQIRDVQSSEAIQRQIRDLAELEISDRTAKSAMLCFHESEIAGAFNRVLQARLEESGMAGNQAIVF